jgi:pimeloyl-ACP methyl ester carboxylesterase
MACFSGVDGTTLVYEDRGEGPAVVLLHGFAANSQVNWVRPGVLEALVRAGYRVVALDQRGHGRSDAPHRPDAYSPDLVVGDVSSLLDHLELQAAAVAGYSFGSRVALLAAEADPRVVAVVLGGAGGPTLTSPTTERAGSLAWAMEAERATEVPEAERGFRRFAEATRSDLAALAALQHALPAWPPSRPERVAVPVLALAGRDDTLAGPPGQLAAAFRHGEAAVVRGNHMNAVADPAFAQAMISFLDRLASW